MLNHYFGPLFGETDSRQVLDSWYMPPPGEDVHLARTVYNTPPSEEVVSADRLRHEELLVPFKPD